MRRQGNASPQNLWAAQAAGATGKTGQGGHCLNSVTQAVQLPLECAPALQVHMSIVAPVPSCAAWLHKELVFVGTWQGSSQLLHVKPHQVRRVSDAICTAAWLQLCHCVTIKASPS